MTDLVKSDAVEGVLVGGDVSKLNTEQRLSYYRQVCESLGLNPLTKPFEYLTLQGKTTLYAKKDCTDQLRQIHNISVNIVNREVVEGVYVVTARATRVTDGRQDESIGALPLPSAPVDRANAIMKCETKAKRRVTLSICGLGMLDETEIETIPGARVATELSQDVAQRRIQEERAKLPAPQDGGYEERHAALVTEAAEILDQPPATPPDAPVKRQRAPRDAPKVSFEMLESFAEVKKLLREATGTDDAYYSVLRGEGYAKSSQIPDRPAGLKAYKALVSKLNSLKQAADLNDTLAHAREVIGDRNFYDILGRDFGLTVDEVLAADGETLDRVLAAIKQAVDEKNGLGSTN